MAVYPLVDLQGPFQIDRSAGYQPAKGCDGQRFARHLGREFPVADRDNRQARAVDADTGSYGQGFHDGGGQDCQARSCQTALQRLDNPDFLDYAGEHGLFLQDIPHENDEEDDEHDDAERGENPDDHVACPDFRTHCLLAACASIITPWSSFACPSLRASW